MNNELQIKINGKPATSLMFKYKLENIASTLTNTLTNKFVNEMMPKVDEYFVTH